MKIALTVIIIFLIIFVATILTLLCSPNSYDKKLENDEQEKFISNYKKLKKTK